MIKIQFCFLSKVGFRRLFKYSIQPLKQIGFPFILSFTSLAKIFTLIAMRSSIIFSLIFVVACGTKKPSELKQVVERSGEEIVIPFKKFVLDNGLTLLVHEDHSDPVVHIDVTYHVGSAREEIGKSGFAHFFEHMMFEGSENVKDGEHFKFITESGGTLNGTTNRDRTNYYETMPANQLEIGLWLEADRMGYLLDAVTQEKFEIQRATVKNERGQNYDNRPYGLIREEVGKNLYPYGHPYSWLTIGYVEDLDRVDVNDLKKFFLRWYGPNNATLTVGGDVEAGKVLELAKKYFGSIPSGPEVANMPKMVPSVESDRYIAKEDKVRLPLVQMVFPSMPRYHEEEYALDCFADILGSGQTSILHKNLIKTQKAVQVFAYNACSELSGEFTVGAVTGPGTKLDSIEKVIRESLLEFETRGVSQEDVDKFVAQRRSSTIYGLSTVDGKTSMLADFQTFTGDANYIAKDLSIYDNLTPEKVMAAYQKYVKGKSSLILSWVPVGSLDLAAADDNYVIDSSQYVPGKDEYADLENRKGEDDFDRSIKPSSGPNPVVLVPEFYTENLENGLKIIGTQSTELPIVNISLVIEGGNRLLENGSGKIGLPSLMASLMNESTENYSAEEMAKQLELLGSSVTVRNSMNSISLNIQSLKENLPATLKLAEEIMMRPAFNEEDFDRVKNQSLQGLSNRETQARQVASYSFQKLLFGSENIAGNPVSGWTETLSSVRREDVKDLYTKAFSPKNGILVAVGDISQAELMENIGFLKNWQGPDVSITQDGEGPGTEGGKIYLIDKAGAAQSEIRIGYTTGINYDPLGEYYKTTLMNFPMGGDYNSRINQNLREDKGFTYGARSRFISNDYNGYFVASSGVKKESTGAAITEFFNEMREYSSSGITDQEIEFLKNSIGQREARAYESPFQKASFLRRIVRYDLPSDYTTQQNQILQDITKEEINKISSKWVRPDEMIILVVGDKAEVVPQLQDLDLEIVELDIYGNPINP